MLSVNHLLLVLNCVMNFVVYCCFNSGFKKVVWPSRYENGREWLCVGMLPKG